ncbi:MAG: TetR/AcrR family transcriptional regulator [Clostridia bacterium]|nr:TetR/AcrR family transcriptional regulator [Clostridia bacterium]
MSTKYYKEAFERCDEERKQKILQTGIDEFSNLGLETANINVIAKKAGISVGLLYKYFPTKEAFFLTCVRHSTKTLNDVLKSVAESDDKILIRAEKLIRAIQRTSGVNSKYVKLYNEITKVSSKYDINAMANEVEANSAKLYREFIEDCIKKGEIRKDCNPALFAFFFDTLLTSLQFSYTCDYYRERLKIFCGEEIFDDDEKMVRELLKFLESAFTFEKSDIKKLK